MILSFLCTENEDIVDFCFKKFDGVMYNASNVQYVTFHKCTCKHIGAFMVVIITLDFPPKSKPTKIKKTDKEVFVFCSLKQFIQFLII